MDEILLLGCLHDDPNKKERITAALKKERPSAITVEVGVDISRQEIASAMRSWDQPLKNPKRYHLNKVGIEAFRFVRDNMFFQEYYASHAFASQNKYPFEQIDHPKHPRLTLLPQNMDLSAYNHPQLLTKQRQRVRGYYMNRKCEMESSHEEMASGQFLDTLRMNDLRIEAGNELRDTYPAQRLMELRATIQGTIVHICGANHLMKDPKQETIYSLINEKTQVRRMLISDYVNDGYKEA